MAPDLYVGLEYEQDQRDSIPGGNPHVDGKKPLMKS